MSPRILVVDDHEIFRKSLKMLLEKQAGLTVVGEAQDGKAALREVQVSRPEVVIMDVSMAGMNGIEATRRLCAEMPDVKVICLSMHAEPTFVESALEAGARAYLLKACSVAELLLAVETVVQGKVFLSPEIASTVVDALRARMGGSASQVAELLSAREREVLQLLAEGRSAKAIAEALNISVKTVATHREHIMAKLDINSVAGLTKYAIQQGLTSSDPRSTA